MGRSASTRERLLDATERIIRERGILAVTTKDIAREAGYAEATLYRHFQNKTELLLAVMAERLAGTLLELIRELPGRAGMGEVAATLEEFVAAAVAFFGQTMPLNVALSADPTLLAEHNRRLRELGAGPEVALRNVAAYIAAEQRLGRAARGRQSRRHRGDPARRQLQLRRGSPYGWDASVVLPAIASPPRSSAL